MKPRTRRGLGLAAGLATLKLMTPQAYARLDANAAQVSGAVGAALIAAGIPHVIQSAGNLFSIFWTDRPVRTYDDARRQDSARYARFFHAMLDAGVWLPPSAYEAWFVSTTLDAEDIAQIPRAATTAARVAAG